MVKDFSFQELIKKKVMLKEVEKMYILAVYESCNNNKTQAAKVLGIMYKTLLKKLQAYAYEDFRNKDGEEVK